MNKSFNQYLKAVCKKKNNFLCIGLDIDPDKLPLSMDATLDSVQKFAFDIIDATIDICPVYKPNMAFYERFGSKGYAVMEKIVEYVNGRAITIADGKRGDIGNTTQQYASAVFNKIGFDSITVAPYMGRDSINPFIQDRTKGAFVLCLTSNKSATDFQYCKNGSHYLYESVADLSMELNTQDNIGLVVGATKTKDMSSLRDRSSHLSWLIPGIGAQGGDLKSSIQIGNRNGIGVINVSRAIIYAGDGSIHAVEAAAQKITQQIRKINE